MTCGGSTLGAASSGATPLLVVLTLCGGTLERREGGVVDDTAPNVDMPCRSIRLLSPRCGSAAVCCCRPRLWLVGRLVDCGCLAWVASVCGLGSEATRGADATSRGRCNLHNF